MISGKDLTYGTSRTPASCLALGGVLIIMDTLLDQRINSNSQSRWKSGGWQATRARKDRLPRLRDLANICKKK